MERKQATPGVIAQLMGLNDPQPRQVSGRPIKVLSEDYLRKTSSLALLEKSSVRKNNSHKRTSEKQHGTDKMFGSSVRVQFSFKRQENCHSDKANPVPRSPHKHSNGFGQCGAKGLDESPRKHLQSKVDSGNISTRILKPKSEKGMDWLRKINQNTSKSVEPFRCNGPTEARNVQFDLRITSRSRSAVGDCTGTSYSSAARSKKIERWRNSKDIQEVSVSDKRCMLGESRLSGSFSRQEDNSSTPLVHSYKIRSANEYLRRLASRTNAINSSVAGETSAGVSEGNRECSTRLSQQKLSHASPEGELIFTRAAMESISVKNSREMSQLSPDSVLEPTFFKEDDDSELSDSSPIFPSKKKSPILDPSGLAMKLLLLNNELEDLSLEGSVMSVSTDKDAEKGSVDLSQDCEKLWRPWRPEESRDFSYLIDVLDEATLFGLNLDTWCETWQEEEHPLSPLLFETLEQKYGKQTSWHKSERRLMFDYVNSGLKAIRGSYMDCRSLDLPLKRRFSATPIKGDIGEELWLQFAREKEAKKDSPEKCFWDVVKWLDLEDDISTICKDIAEVLFDEVATEICSSA